MAHITSSNHPQWRERQWREFSHGDEERFQGLLYVRRQSARNLGIFWGSFGDLRPRARSLAIMKRNKRFPAPSEFQTSSGTIPFQISSRIPSLPHFLLRRFVISRSCSFMPAIKPFMETTSSRFEPGALVVRPPPPSPLPLPSALRRRP